MMEIGNLRERIDLQRQVETSDGIGGVVSAWTGYATVWAAVTPRLGGEATIEGRTAAIEKSTFTIRLRSDVAETDRIVWQGVTWNVRRIVQRGSSRRMMEIDAERGVA